MSRRGSAVVGDVAVIDGEVAGWIARLCGDWRRDAVRLGCPVSMLADVERAIIHLREASVDRREPAFPGENGKGRERPGASESEVWVTSSEAGQLLGITRQRVGQLATAGDLPATRTGGHLRLPLWQVLAYREARHDGAPDGD